jgi:predicted nucleic acid-binding protein
VHLLDTDTLTHLQAGHPRVVHHLHELTDPDVGITIITKIELLRGRYDYVLKATSGPELLKAQQLLSRTEAFLDLLQVLPFDESATTRFDQLRQSKRAPQDWPRRFTDRKYHACTRGDFSDAKYSLLPTCSWSHRCELG